MIRKLIVCALLLWSIAPSHAQQDPRPDINRNTKGTLPLTRLDDVRSASADVDGITTSDTGLVQIKFPRAASLLRLSCSTDAGSATINFDVRAENTTGTAGANILSAPLSCSPSTGTTTTFAISQIAAHSLLSLQPLTVAGAVRLHFYFEFRFTQ